MTDELVASSLSRADNPPITGKRDFMGKRVHVVHADRISAPISPTNYVASRADMNGVSSITCLAADLSCSVQKLRFG